MGNNPKVTIAIPAYNASKYLKEAIDSALAQTYKNIEIIVVNDGSNDNGKTEQIAKSYGEKIKYYHKENGGVSTALNLAISEMTGDFFSWLSHDDRYYPEKVEKQIKYLEGNNLLNSDVILYSDYDLMNSYSEVFATSIKNHEELVEKPEYCLLRGAINGLSLLIPKRAFQECGTFDEKLSCAQDYELWERMQKKYKFIHQPEILVTTRLHDLQQGNTSPKMLKEGNEFWTNLIKHTSQDKRIELEGTEYNFYAEMHKFLKTTPYEDTMKYTEEEMHKLEEESKKIIKNIKVSVIIPFFNRIPKLLNAIESVLNQTHEEIEIILIDDGSKDSVKEVLELVEKNKDKIKYIRQEQNKGASCARNIGIKVATGEYIAFLDSDDLFKSEKIEKQLKEIYLRGYKFCHTSYIRKNNDKEQFINSGELNGKALPKIIGGCGIATPTVMIETSFLRENNLQYDENLEIGEDVCFYFEVLSKTDTLGLEEPLTIVNTNDTSAAYNVDKQLLGLKTIIKYVLNDSNFQKYNYELGLLFKEYIRVFDSGNKDKILQEYETYKNITNSTSWKLTKPLRVFKNVINLYKTQGFIATTKRIIGKILKK